MAAKLPKVAAYLAAKKKTVSKKIAAAKQAAEALKLAEIAALKACEETLAKEGVGLAALKDALEELAKVEFTGDNDGAAVAGRVHAILADAISQIKNGPMDSTLRLRARLTALLRRSRMCRRSGRCRGTRALRNSQKLWML